jgi:putative ABC transport system ATP-binding protein
MTLATSQEKPQILIENLAFSYPGAAPVLKISRLEIQRGERVFIQGPSGSGKSTLLGLLTGVLIPQQGRVQVLGQDLNQLSSSARDRFRGRHIGYVFQQFNLLPYLTARQNILVSCELNPDRPESSRSADHLVEIASALGLTELLDRSVVQLSVGQQQRVAVARALLGSPEILIADEPTSALDSDHRAQFIDLLIQEANKRKTTVLFVSHDRELARHFDRSIHLLELQ